MSAVLFGKRDDSGKSAVDLPAQSARCRRSRLMPDGVSSVVDPGFKGVLPDSASRTRTTGVSNTRSVPRSTPPGNTSRPGHPPRRRICRLRGQALEPHRLATPVATRLHAPAVGEGVDQDQPPPALVEFIADGRAGQLGPSVRDLDPHASGGPRQVRSRRTLICRRINLRARGRQDRTRRRGCRGPLRADCRSDGARRPPSRGC